VGGPIVKDKGFFDANYEGLRQSLGQTFTNFVPNAAFRDQVLATSPVLKPLLDSYPMGQVAVDSITDQLTKVATKTVREDAGMFRFDYQFNDRTTAYARHNVDNAYMDARRTLWEPTMCSLIFPPISFCSCSTPSRRQPSTK
jgi:hypothetical protein